MPAVANPVTFSKNSADYGYRGQKPLVSFDDLPINIGRKPIPTSGIPSYGYKVGTSTPFRPGVSEDAARSTPIRSSFTVPKYNVMENAGMNEYGSYDMPGTGEQIEEMLKGTIGEGLVLGGIGTAGAALLGKNLTGMDIGNVPILKDIPFIGRGLKELDYFLDPSWANAKDASGFFKGTGRFINDFPDRAEDFMGPNSIFGQGKVNPNYSGGPVGGYASPTKILSSLSSGLGSLGPLIKNTINTVGPGNAISFNSLGGSSAPGTAGINTLNGNVINPFTGKPIGGGTIGAKAGTLTTTEPGFMNSIGNFFNQSRSFIPGVSGTGASATGFGGAGQAGSGITSIGNVLGAAGGLLSLADFIDDPSLASGLGTLAGAGASGIGAFSGLATAAPYLALAAVAAGLLMNKKPSNKTGYTSIDLDEFKPVSFGMEGKKYSKENVDQTMQIMEPIIPLIQQLEEQYGVDLKGDIQVNYGGRDGLAYNIGNRDVSGFRNRLDYFDGKDQSTRDGGSIFRKTFKGENSGKDFYKSLLGDLETLAKQKQAEGGGEIDLANYRGVQRQAPQMTGAFSYGLPGGTPNAATPPKPTGGPQGVFTYGYDT